MPLPSTRLSARENSTNMSSRRSAATPIPLSVTATRQTSSRSAATVTCGTTSSAVNFTALAEQVEQHRVKLVGVGADDREVLHGDVGPAGVEHGSEVESTSATTSPRSVSRLWRSPPTRA